MEEVDKEGTAELEKEMMGNKLEVVTKGGEIYSGLLDDIVFGYIHLQLQNGSGVWIPKKSIVSVEEVKVA